MSKVYVVDGIEYTKSNRRMRYNPEFHDRHGQAWNDEELSYLCKMKGSMKYADLSLALGRTQGVCAEKYCTLKKRGLIEYYKNLEVNEC